MAAGAAQPTGCRVMLLIGGPIGSSTSGEGEAVSGAAAGAAEPSPLAVGLLTRRRNRWLPSPVPL
jgi:hypothetical protein